MGAPAPAAPLAGGHAPAERGVSGRRAGQERRTRVRLAAEQASTATSQPAAIMRTRSLLAVLEPAP